MSSSEPNDIYHRIHAKLNQRLASRGVSFKFGQVALAINKYQRIMFKNVMSGTASPEWLNIMAGISEETPEKSGLLMRLLDDKMPLKRPGPTSFSAPAYPFIDAPIGTEHRVSVRFDGDIVVIDQCTWQILGANEPAREMQEMLSKGEHGFEESRFLLLCAQGPVWDIRFGEWPGFQLMISRVRGMTADRDHVLSNHGRANYADATTNGHWGNVRLLDQRAWAAYEADGWVITKSQEWSGYKDVYLEIDEDGIPDELQLPDEILKEIGIENHRLEHEKRNAAESIYIEGHYMIFSMEFSHGKALWWGSRNSGLFDDIHMAGTYTRSEALEILRTHSGRVAIVPMDVITRMTKRLTIELSDRNANDVSNNDILEPYIASSKERSGMSAPHAPV